MKKFFGLETSSIQRISISSLTEEECIKFLTPYKEHITTVDDWVSFKKENPNLMLPSKNTLLRYFGTWNIMKEKLGLNINIRTDMILLEKMDYLKLLEPYKEHLQGVDRWYKFRAEHPELKLPSIDTLTICFEGSWFKVKEAFGVVKNG